MDIEFNFINKKRKSTLILCKPNREELYALGMAKEVKYSKDFNAVSELTFQIPKYKDSDIIPYYEKVQSNRLVKIEDVGIYIITKTKRKQKGTNVEYKEVTCVGLEHELASGKNLDILDGTYCLYDATNSNTEKSIMHIVLSYLPSWSISEVDSDLWDTWRTFSIQDVNIYNFLMGEISQTYDCVFLFDTFKRQIKVVKTDNLKKQTDIYMSGRNLVKELEMEESSDNLITALTVYGDGDLSIRTVNPLGTATIYNFDYFMTTDWMSQKLINAIAAWKEKYAQSETQFTTLLSQLKTLQNELVILESQLVDLETAKKESERGQSLAITAGDNVACSAYATQIKETENNIASKKVEITNKKTAITTTQVTLVQIPNSLSLENTDNFSIELRKELDPYIKQASIQNTDYAITDEMTNDEVIQVATDLFNWGKSQLDKSSQPIWTFNISSINFLNLIEYKYITNQLDLGSEVTIEVDKMRDLYAYAMLIGYTIKLDSPDDIELRFSSALNFKRTSMTYDEVFQKTASISKSYDFESPSWKKGNEAYNKMNEYINQGFVDLTKDILSADNQEFTISNTGIRGREYLPATDTYSPEELRMTKNVLAFSDDYFNSTKAAIGRYQLPDGSWTYGVIAESLVGKQILGKTLFLETEDKSLVWNGEGLTIKNANIIMTNDEGVDQTVQDMIGDIDLSKYDNVLTAGGLLDTGKMQGQILAGNNNIICLDDTQGKSLKLNENGILISNKKDSTGQFIWSTAISADGIVADMIKAGGTIQGCSLRVGESATKYMTIDEKGVIKGVVDGTETFRIAHNSQGNMFLYSPSRGTRISLNSSYSWNLTVGGRDYNGVGIYSSGGDGLAIGSNLYIIGDYTATGAKNAVVPTEHYGARLLYSEESDRVYFNTYGKSETVSNEAIIEIDKMFLETIEPNSECPYIINLTPYGDSKIWIESVTDNTIIIRSDKDVKFDYGIRCIRKNYKDKCLEEA